MKNILTRPKAFSAGLWKKALQHKIISVILTAAVVGGGYYAYNNLNAASAQTRYVLAAAGKGTVVASVSGTGQVSASNQVDLKAKVSGDVVKVNVQQGEEVKAGTLVVQLDDTIAQKAVRDAEVNLQSAQLALEKLEMPADKLSLIQAQNALSQAKEAQQAAGIALNKSYSDAFNAISNVVLGESSLMTFLSTISSNQADPNFSYTAISNLYIQNLNDYQSANLNSDQSTLDALLDETYNTVQAISNGIKITNNSTYSTAASTYLSSLVAVKTEIQSAKSGVSDAAQSVAEKTESLNKLQAGALPIDIQSQQLVIQQKQNALKDAKDQLANYYITAPFDGFVATLNVNKGDSIASIQSYGAIATLISKGRIADVSLNEVDAAKVKVGQEATLTFDAFPDLTIAGKVVQVDAIGTVTQGVVDYGVEISFDSQDNRIKPGMSVSAQIVTDVHQDVIAVPNSAVKSQGSSYYVEVLPGVSNTAANLSSQGIVSQTAPQVQAVEIGLQSGSMTEITGGLSESEMVVTRTISGTGSAGSSAQSPNGTRATGIGGIGGGTFNILRATGGGGAGR